MNTNEMIIFKGVKCTETELNVAYERAILNKSDVLVELENMKRENILQKHEQSFSKIWQASDGRYKTKLPDGSKYGKLIAKTTRENLENCIVDFYKKQEKDARITLAHVYPDWLEYQYLASGKNGTANKSQWVWNKYFKDASIVKIPLEELTTGKLSRWLLKVINDNHLTRKRYNEIKGVLNPLYDYCVSDDNINISINLARQIFFKSKNLFADEAEKVEEEIIFTAKTKAEVIAEAMKQFSKTRNTAYLAICLNFNFGLRVGELVALRLKDIDGDILHIRRSEVKTFTADKDGNIHKSDYKVETHTKTEAGKRDLVITPDAKAIFDMILKENAAKGVSDEDYIFIGKNGERMHEYSVNNVLRRCCGVRDKKDHFVIEGKPSGNHAIRKTCISELHDSQLLPDIMITKFAGHKDISTTQKHYIHAVKSLDTKAEVFAKVFSTKAM